MKLQSYNDFWNQTHQRAKVNGLPLRVMFEVTYRCNFKCGHCYLPNSYKKKSKPELKTKEVFYILKQLADIGCFYLGFTGGEPFLREDIFEILWYAKKKGFQLIIYTNGSLIDEKKAVELKRLNLNKVDITIPALNKLAFEHITGTNRYQDKFFRAINLLHKNKINLGFKSCLLKENEEEIKGIQNFAISLGAPHRLDTMLSRRLDGDKRPYMYRGSIERAPGFPGSRVPGKDEFGNCSLDAQNPERNTQYAIRNTLFKCGVGLTQVAITPYGELKMCAMIDYPKYKILNAGAAKSQGCKVTSKNGGLRQAWEKLKNLVSQIKPDENYQCAKCQLYDYCKWCPAVSWLYNRSFTVCDPQRRDRAGSMQQKIGGMNKRSDTERK